MSLVEENEQELLGKHLIFEWSESNHSSLQGISQVPGFSQDCSFACFVD